MIFLVIGGCLTIIGGVLLGMFFLYPLANVIPEEQYIEVFEEEFTMLIAILGFGLLSLIIGFIFEGIALSIEYEAYYKIRLKFRWLCYLAVWIDEMNRWK